MALVYRRSMRSTTALTVNSRARSRPAAPNPWAARGSRNTDEMACARARTPSRRDQEPRDPVDDHVDDTSDGAGDDRSTRGHRLEHNGWAGVAHNRWDAHPTRPWEHR